MEQDMEKRNPVLDAMERQGYLKGRKEGIEIYIENWKEGWQKGWEIGWEKGIRIGTLRVLNWLVHDSGNDYSVEQLAEKFGYSVEEILNATD